MTEIKITSKEENQRLDKYLLKYFNKAPKSFVYKMLRKKRIKYNNQKAEGNEIIKAGDTLQMYLASDTMDAFMEEKKVYEVKIEFDILYEDENVLFVIKPIGLLTHPEKAEDRNTLVDQVLFYLNQKGEYDNSKTNTFTPAACNRLDRNTGGIVVFGKNLMSVQELNKAISNMDVDKYYLTIVKGKVNRSSVETAYIYKDSSINKVEISNVENKNTKKIVTGFRPIKSTHEYTMLEVDLITGKSHQIRAHLASLGLPIIGDRKYGDEKINNIFKTKFSLENQFLFAYKITFKISNGSLSYLNNKVFEAMLPPVYENIKNYLFS